MFLCLQFVPINRIRYIMTRRNTQIIIICGIKAFVISAIWTKSGRVARNIVMSVLPPALARLSVQSRSVSIRVKFLILLLLSRWSPKDIKTCLEQLFCLAPSIFGPSLGSISGSVSGSREYKVPGSWSLSWWSHPLLLSDVTEDPGMPLKFHYILLSRIIAGFLWDLGSSSSRKTRTSVTMSHFTTCHA